MKGGQWVIKGSVTIFYRRECRLGKKKVWESVSTIKCMEGSTRKVSGGARMSIAYVWRSRPETGSLVGGQNLMDGAERVYYGRGPLGQYLGG